MEFDIRKYAGQMNLPNNEKWERAGYVKLNKNGKYGAPLKTSIYIKFTPEGSLILPVGEDQRVTIPPKINKTTVTYKFGGTAISLPLEQFSKLLLGEDISVPVTVPPPYNPEPKTS
ncbi:hypothetical protein [Bacteroides sp.]|uniref:hypothetical protein n=1 Tax=Bacteroides sp. TaxID=29523 RepID=UPI0026388D84|nr:hypothetical protein [Bacteroides sp.]MDD3039054.1 hypothetical protein [Bacteroides sp.]